MMKYIENYEEICMIVCTPMWNMGPFAMNQPNVRLPPLVSLRKILV